MAINSHCCCGSLRIHPASTHLPPDFHLNPIPINLNELNRFEWIKLHPTCNPTPCHCRLFSYSFFIIFWLKILVKTTAGRPDTLTHTHTHTNSSVCVCVTACCSMPKNGVRFSPLQCVPPLRPPPLIRLITHTHTGTHTHTAGRETDAQPQLTHTRCITHTPKTRKLILGFCTHSQRTHTVVHTPGASYTPGASLVTHPTIPPRCLHTRDANHTPVPFTHPKAPDAQSSYTPEWHTRNLRP